MAVSDCLVPFMTLMDHWQDRSARFDRHAVKMLFDASKHAARRGATHGLAGVVKRLGIGGTKQYDVTKRLRVASEGEKWALSPTPRWLFEPYSVNQSYEESR